MLDFPTFVLARMVHTLDLLPAELWLAVFGLFGAEATIQDWRNVERTCRGWRSRTGRWFAEWIRAQRNGIAFGESVCGREELMFLKRHPEGKHCCVCCGRGLTFAALRVRGASIEVFTNAPRQLTVMRLSVPVEKGWTVERLLRVREVSYGSRDVEHYGWRGPRVLLRAQWRRKSRSYTKGIVSDLCGETVDVLAKKVLPQLRSRYEWFQPNPTYNRGANWRSIFDNAMEGLLRGMHGSGERCSCSIRHGLICRACMEWWQPKWRALCEIHDEAGGSCCVKSEDTWMGAWFL